MNARFRLLIRWLLAGVVASTVLWTVAQAALTLAIDGPVGFLDSLPIAPMAIVAGLVWSILAGSLYAPVLAQWPSAAQKWPSIESSRTGFILATGLLALPPMIIAPHVAASSYVLGSADYVRTFLVWLLPVGLMWWGGLSIPRLLLPSLRLGLFTLAAA